MIAPFFQFRGSGFRGPIRAGLAVALAFVGTPGWPAVINVAPGDTYTKLEAARAGDEVVIAPGTYAFRLYFTAQGTPTNPIVIRAQDPTNPPVWDFGAILVENAPGSYGAGDRGRGGWQFSGAKNYRVSGIVFRNCRTASLNSAGMRYYNGSTNLYLKDCKFFSNDNGLTGGTQESEITVEHCEFATNGNLSAGSPTHNLYIYGGTFTMRYCYVHDSVQAQNFHLRARNALLEYNWFARAKSYEGDLMSDDDFSGAGPFAQTLTLRGNVFIQHPAPNNHSQVIALYNDGGLASLNLSVRAIHNTFVGNGGFAAFVHLSNADGTAMSAELSNNILFGTTRNSLIENTNVASVSGRNNWLPTNAIVGTLTASIQYPSPGFRNPAQADYTLVSNSVCVGAASTQVFGLPGREYFRSEVTNRLWRIRAATRDVGAFESTTTNKPVGPYDPLPAPRLNALRNGNSPIVSWPLYAADYRLESSPSLYPLVWNSAGYPTSTSATDVHVTLPAAAAPSFFRLRK